jgi:hypothetical protein
VLHAACAGWRVAQKRASQGLGKDLSLAEYHHITFGKEGTFADGWLPLMYSWGMTENEPMGLFGLPAQPCSTLTSVTFG